VDPRELRRVVAANVRRLAARRGMSITQLAGLAGIDRAGLSRCLTGRAAMTTDRLCRLANALEVVPRELVDERSVPARVTVREVPLAANPSSVKKPQSRRRIASR